jgi:hypothetical protein
MKIHSFCKCALIGNSVQVNRIDWQQHYFHYTAVLGGFISLHKTLVTKGDLLGR